MVAAASGVPFACKSPKGAPRGRTLFCASPILPGFARRGAGCTGPGCSVSPRPEGRKHFHRCNCRGHRPCHSATLTSGLPYCGWHRSCVGRPAWAGKRGSRFLIPPGPKPSFRRTQSSAISVNRYCPGDICSAAVRNASSQNQSEVLLSRQTCRAVWKPRRILAQYWTAPATK